MSISCISDIHVTTVDSKQYALLLSFIRHEKVQNSKRVMFLGDIFDHLTGEHHQYLEKYSEFFNEVAKLLDKGVRVYYLEGNHDFHFKRTFNSALKKLCSNSANLSNFQYSSVPVEVINGNKSITFCHGDDLDLNNKAYQRWKKIYSSKAFGFFISNLLPYKLVEHIGDKASSNSRERGKASFVYDQEKAKYREAAKEFLENIGGQILVAGHTHIPDIYSWNGKTYANIGFPPRDNEFLFIENGKLQKVLIQ
ncbi:MAG: hypothetical protein CME64_15160 [Halobacteriovoraceae bacterium]|nr:hypothetical protein [Halobacteriovoraceae bacterium]|tara:strand:+ start:73474 stop:74229 length:756 start_codon:yes stop_codon:yes gene_type:complete